MGELPGVPLSSGFDYRPVEDFPELALSKEARDRVLAFMDEVDRCRARAAVAAQFYVIGGAAENASPNETGPSVASPSAPATEVGSDG